MIVVSAGGGRVGEPLLRAALECTPPTRGGCALVAGPLMPEDAFRNLTPVPAGDPHRGDCPRGGASVPDLGAELARASGSVSQCGYNTALEILRARVPALVVPYATPEEDEQMRRARRLERLGVLNVTDLDRLAGDVADLERSRRPRRRSTWTARSARTDLLWDLRPARAAA